MRVIEAMPKFPSTTPAGQGGPQPGSSRATRILLSTLRVIGGTLLVLISVPLIALLVVVARPLGVVLALIAVPLLLLYGRRPHEDPVIEEHHGIRVPPRHLLTAAHAWLTPAAKHGVLVGADDLLLRALGPVEQVILPKSGTKLTPGDVLFSLRRGDRQVDVRVPFAAEVLGRNEVLLTKPGMVGTSPYLHGWVLRVWPSARLEGPDIRSAEEASGWFRQQVDRLLARVAPAPVPAMPDGGVISPDFHELIDAPTWQAVRDEFFS
ncbi:MAG: hypothetical protein H6730_11045 [Deltaproteobacteria bacterium]|nr:hypothetical protein [Deltaproteobacteria bacterium]